MYLDDYIRYLEFLRAEHGNVEVDTRGYDGRDHAREPKANYRKILGSRERRPSFWTPYDGPAKKGVLVIEI